MEFGLRGINYYSVEKTRRVKIRQSQAEVFLQKANTDVEHVSISLKEMTVSKNEKIQKMVGSRNRQAPL